MHHAVCTYCTLQSVHIAPCNAAHRSLRSVHIAYYDLYTSHPAMRHIAPCDLYTSHAQAVHIFHAGLLDIIKNQDTVETIVLDKKISNMKLVEHTGLEPATS